MTGMTIKAAQAAIEAIMAAIPDDELPQFDRLEHNSDGSVVAWWGSTGHHLGRGTRNGKREPLIHRTSGAWHAIESEMTYRADKKFLEDGDGATAVDANQLTLTDSEA